jgi:hypothetical protein
MVSQWRAGVWTYPLKTPTSMMNTSLWLTDSLYANTIHQTANAMNSCSFHQFPIQDKKRNDSIILNATTKIHLQAAVWSRHSWVGIALGYGLDDRGSRVRFPARAGNFSLHHRVQNGSEAHPASYPVGTGSSFPGVKRPGREADHSPPSSTEVKECVELYLHSPNTPSWRGA